MNLHALHKKLRLTKLRDFCLTKVLYIILFITGRKLHLYNISLPDPIIISGNHFSLFWKISGCYKITINDETELPGNINVISLNYDQIQGVLKIRFYGVTSVLERKFPITSVSVELRQNRGLDCHTRNFLFSPASSLSRENIILP